jgi:pentatricopeptide repeat protein
MKFSTLRPPYFSGLYIYAAVTLLWANLHVWQVQAFSRNVFPSPRGVHAGVRAVSSTLLHAAPSKKTTAHSVSIPPTTTNATRSSNAEAAAVGTPQIHAGVNSSNSSVNLLEELGRRHANGDKLTQEYCDSIVAYCVASDEWDSVLDVLDIMKTQNLYQVRSTYQACLRACLDVPNAASAKEILTAMEQAGVPPVAADIAVTVATMCRQEKTEKGWWKKALQLLLTGVPTVPAQSSESSDNNNTITEQQQTQIPVYAYDAVLSCMADDREWKEASRLLRRMEQEKQHTQPVVSTYRWVIECCVRSQQAEQAAQVLQSCVQTASLVPAVYSFEMVISALTKKRQWRRAVQLLDVMDDLKVPKTLLIYNTLLSACANAREHVQAKNLLVQMRKSGIQPNIMSYNAVMSACAKSSRWKDALAVLDQCHREPGVAPDVYTYTIAMRACAKGM